MVLREGCQGKACLSLCSLSPGAPRGVPGEGLSVVCLLVLQEGCQGKACLPAGTPTMLGPLSLSSSSLCSDFPLNLSSFIIFLEVSHKLS